MRAEMNDSEEVDKSEGSSVTTTTHTVERKEITRTICHRTHNKSTNSNFSPEASPSSSSSHTHHQALQSPSSIIGLPSSVAQNIKPSPGVQPIIERGFKHYGYRMRLYCRTGYCLTVHHDRSVHSDELLTHPGGVLEFSSAGIGEVRMRAVDANLYLAMNKKGDLYGEEDPRNYATVFIEGTSGQYNTYLSQKYAHLGWYIGIKKNGTIKKGPLTKWGQKAIQFLPVRSTE